MKRGHAGLLTVLFLMSATRLFGQTTQDTLVVIGGFSGTWDTDFVVGNPSSTPLAAAIQAEAPPLGVPCPPNCTSTSFSIPANGSVDVSASKFLGSLEEGPRILRIAAAAGVAFVVPAVRARLVNRALPSQSTDLPVVRESAIAALNATELSFPAATRSSTAHTNLIIARVAGTSPSLAIRVEAFSPSGDSLGSGTFSVSGAPTTLFLVDVLGQLGVEDLTDGLIRVTRTVGDGAIWGLLATAFADGRVSTSVGGNP